MTTKQCSSSANTICCSCGRQAVEVVLDLGVQPPSNLFLADQAQAYPLHPLHFGVCTDCGLAQLVNPMPEMLVRCTHDWLRYNEPEQHLDSLAELLSSVAGPKVRSCGISNQDSTLLERLRHKGWDSVSLPHDNTRVDVVLARRILEHSHSPRRFVEECLRLLSPDGYLVFEVPGCEAIIRNHWHCFLWEEHTLYFTKASFRTFLQLCGLEILELIEYPMPLENSLVALVRPARTASCAQPPLEETSALLTPLREFGASFPRIRDEMQGTLNKVNKAGHTVSMLGAGHLSMKFINFYGLGSFLQYVLDDHPRKQGTYLPGSLLPVFPSTRLEQEGSLCLCAMHPERLESIQPRYRQFAARGGKWLSIFSNPQQISF